MSNPENYNFIPLDVLKKAKTGLEVIADSWWIVDPVRGAMFYKRGKTEIGAPQCNRDKRVAEMVHKNIYPETEIIFIDVAYIPMRDYSHN